MSSTYLFKRTRGVVTSHGNSGTVGFGSFGQVRDCFHQAFGRIAVKCVQFNGTSQGVEDLCTRLTSELSQLRHITHPNIVQLFGITTWLSNFGIITEFMEGGCLSDFLSESNLSILPWTLRVSIAFDVTKALAYLHYVDPDQPTVHGNLKPQNILLTWDLRAKLSDVGIVQAMTSSCASNSVHNGSTNQSTVLYSAPELLDDITMDYTTAMDMYSFSMTVYEIIVRNRVFQKVSGNLALVISTILGKGQRPDQKPLKTIRTSLKSQNDVEIFDIMCKIMVECWDQDPSYRPDASSVSGELGRLISTISAADMLEGKMRALNRRQCNRTWHYDITQYIPLDEHYKHETGLKSPLSPTASEIDWHYVDPHPVQQKSAEVETIMRESTIIFFVANEPEQCSVFEFVPSSKSFNDLPKLFWEWNDSTAVVLQDTLYVIGSNSVFCLKLDGGKSWESKAPMLHSRTHAAAATMDGEIFVFGGIDENRKQLASIECYNPPTNAWRNRGKLKKRRFGHNAIVHHGKAYCIGGANANVECYNPKDDSTTILTRTPNRNGFSTVICNGVIYDIGGSIKSQAIHFNIDCYDISSDLWRKEDDHKTERSQGCACAIGDKIYLIGGWSKVTSTQYIEEYDTVLKRWRTVTTMNHGFIKYVCVS